MDPSDGVGWVHLQTLVYPPIINPLGYIWRPRKPKIVPDRFSPKLNPNPYMWAKSTARKIVCIGRNYAEHAKELGNKVPTTPMIFLKPTSSIISQPNPIELPKLSVVHHELELGVVIGKDGRDIAVEQAWDYVKGYSLCLDMTARNFQDEAKKNGHPWTVSMELILACQGIRHFYSCR
jgi:2-keto-4-pentenoate hydratase/2-oxohepta-3-ene-1,7-dioic acid hydratase in catechol pathway